MSKLILNPTLACADRMNMGADVDTLMELGAELFHIDIMDGHYVPNLCLDLDTIRAIKKRSNAPLDIHIMVTNPFDYIDRLAALEPEYLSFHIDSTPFSLRLIGEIQKRGIKPGVVLNPTQRVDMLEHVLGSVKMVQFMSVEPGFAGQSFIPDTLAKIEKLADIRKQAGVDFAIAVDGGIDIEYGRKCADAGADIIVVGALAIFLPYKSLESAYVEFEEAMSK